MSLMEWSEELDIKVDDMNNEHKNLLNIMNLMFDMYKENPNNPEFRGLFLSLKDATVEHFTNEEEFMEKMNFSGIATHKIIHKKLLETFGEHLAKYEENGSVDHTFFDFLKFWLRSHIVGIDTKYGQEYQDSQKTA
ncbi:bacteriohemerythrin [Halobacteriovorax sp. HLS]|uniref:bacteriohemerythrin n=1 Tax=Halobacteriovorax sp. HLS TaxID=2234000 RepID=UPI000FDB99DF|nr:bacteriohemerythrin [Halobacteriovorax sp. HLS]